MASGESKGSRRYDKENLLWQSTVAIRSDPVGSEFVFDPSTPPMLLMHGDGDGWSAMNSVRTWEQLRRMGIQGELHTLVKRGHCFQKKASPGTASYTWMERVRDFIFASAK